MQLKSTVIGILGLAAALSAGAATIDYGSFTLDYDASTVFGTPSFSFGSGGGVTGFGWSVPDTVQVLSEGLPALATFDLPSYTITAKAGWALSGPVTGFLGNLVFNEFKGSTSATVDGSVAVNGGPAVAFSQALARDETTITPNFKGGTYAGTGTLALGSFTSFSFSGGTLTLSATSAANSFASIIAQPQNELKIGLVANPVPEPETYALMLAGLGVLGLLARRRSKA